MAEENRTLNETTETAEAAAGAAEEAPQVTQRGIPAEQIIKEADEADAKDIVEKILPVVDNFERGLATVEHPEDDPFADGMNKIYKQLTKALEDMGVTVIEAVGKEFDPNLHNAVMHVEDESVGENVIVEEFQKGYKYKDIVVRHSMVKVAN